MAENRVAISEKLVKGESLLSMNDTLPAPEVFCNLSQNYLLVDYSNAPCISFANTKF